MQSFVPSNPQTETIYLTKRLSSLRASESLASVVETSDTCPHCAAPLMKLESDKTGSRFCAFCGYHNAGVL